MSGPGVTHPLSHWSRRRQDHEEPSAAFMGRANSICPPRRFPQVKHRGWTRKCGQAMTDQIGCSPAVTPPWPPPASALLRPRRTQALRLAGRSLSPPYRLGRADQFAVQSTMAGNGGPTRAVLHVVDVDVDPAALTGSRQIAQRPLASRVLGPELPAREVLSAEDRPQRLLQPRTFRPAWPPCSRRRRSSGRCQPRAWVRRRRRD